MKELFEVVVQKIGKSQSFDIFETLLVALPENQLKYYRDLLGDYIPEPDWPIGKIGYKHWFTRNGLHKIIEVLRDIICELNEVGWKMCIRLITVPEMLIEDHMYYKDRYQVVMPTIVHKDSKMSSWIEIKDEKDYDLIVKPIAKNVYLPIKFCPTCKKFYHESSAKSRYIEDEICTECGIREALTAAGCDKGQIEVAIEQVCKSRRLLIGQINN